MRDYPHSRSIEGIKNLAKLRGNQVGYDFAEAFEVPAKLYRDPLITKDITSIKTIIRNFILRNICQIIL